MRVLLAPLFCAVLCIGASGCKRPAAGDAPTPVASPPASAPDLDSGAMRPAADASATATDPCFVGAGASAELSELRSCDRDAPSEDWDGADALAITASPATVRAEPGGIGDLVVHYANRTEGPIVLRFDDSPLRGHVVAHHPDGRRADGAEAPPPAWATTWAKSPRRYRRVTLGPRAVLDERKMWFASRWKWAPNDHEKQWPRSLLGPLPKGTYVLRVRTSLVVRATGERVEYAEATTNARVDDAPPGP
jgi:hypothetical protein